MPEPRQRPRRGNKLLDLLPLADYQKLRSDFQDQNLVFGAVLYEAGAVIRHVYFPTSGLLSLLGANGTESNLEVGVVGREGMIGLPVFLDVTRSQNRVVVQGEGLALKMTAGAFSGHCDSSASLAKILQRYTHSLLAQVSQSVVCNRFHTIDERLARWLLMTRDRMSANQFRLTQEFLAIMLGVRREGVNRAAGSLQRQSLISFRRGVLTILNAKKLEAAACECYGITKREYETQRNRSK